MNLYLVNLLCLNKDLAVPLIEKHPDIGYLITYPTRKELTKVIDLGITKIMFDCGAYSAYTQGITIDKDELIEYYQKIKVEYPNIDFTFIALDVIGDKENGWESYRNWKYMNEKVDCIPTYHYGDSVEVLDAYASETNYIAIGGLVTARLTKKVMSKFLSGIFSRHPNHKFHLFGVNNFSVTQKFNVYSCDSLTWRSGSRFGTLIGPFGSFNVSSRSKKCITKQQADANGVTQLLKKYGLEFPFPEDFNYYELDVVNISILYDEIVNKEFSNPVGLLQAELF